MKHYQIFFPIKIIENFIILFRRSRISTFWLKNLVGFVVHGVKVVLRFAAAVRGMKTTNDESWKAAGRSHQLSNGFESIEMNTWTTTMNIPQ
jgi:hypothetical protein